VCTCIVISAQAACTLHLPATFTGSPRYSLLQNVSIVLSLTASGHEQSFAIFPFPASDDKDSSLFLYIQGVSKRALQWYSRCSCVMKTFTPKDVQTIHGPRCSTVDTSYAFKRKRLW
jgi:hypothetical protein